MSLTLWVEGICSLSGISMGSVLINGMNLWGL